ncbi:hypothetical protein WH47_04625 [Habropoda laboriosa]|uniref:Uncharacterized protein n=1 Tax=Habropoda laboriosa TaxID=597456 RepID=A0A0L7R2D1_9HYME|nr:hypothetical protein WH47_04625 [Habropoda laboriosa]
MAVFESSILLSSSFLSINDISLTDSDIPISSLNNSAISASNFACSSNDNSIPVVARDSVFTSFSTTFKSFPPNKD